MKGEEAENTIKLSSHTKDSKPIDDLAVTYYPDGVVAFKGGPTALDQSQLNVLMDFIQRQREQFDHPQRHY